MNDKKCCGEKVILPDKLGSCPFCIVTSILLTIVSWSAYLIISQYSIAFWLKAIVLIVCCLFSMLALSHAVAYFIKKNNRNRGK